MEVCRSEKKDDVIAFACGRGNGTLTITTILSSIEAAREETGFESLISKVLFVNVRCPKSLLLIF
jgi:hypothetical protein